MVWRPKPPCECERPYIGTQLAGEEVRCERCGGTVEGGDHHE